MLGFVHVVSRSCQEQAFWARRSTYRVVTLQHRVIGAKVFEEFTVFMPYVPLAAEPASDFMALTAL